jgi:hypothetical protein
MEGAFQENARGKEGIIRHSFRAVEALPALKPELNDE